jgi:hypothetical protein
MNEILEEKEKGRRNTERRKEKVTQIERTKAVKLK